MGFICSERLTEKLTKVPGGAAEQVCPKLNPVFKLLILLSLHFFLDRGNIGCPISYRELDMTTPGVGFATERGKVLAHENKYQLME